MVICGAERLRSYLLADSIMIGIDALIIIIYGVVSSSSMGTQLGFNVLEFC